MRKILGGIATHPIVIFGILALIAGVFAWQLPALTFNFWPEYEQAPEWSADSGAGPELFGVVVVKSRHGDIFTPAALTLLAELTSEIETLDGVAAVESLSTVARITRGTGFVRVEKLMNPLRFDDAALADLREAALQDDRWTGNLISEDGATAAINVYAQPSPGLSQEEHAQNIMEEIESALTSVAFDGHDVYQIGMPLIRMTGNDRFRTRLLLVLPLVILLLSVVLFASFRTVAGAAFAVLSMGLSLLAALGFMAWMGYPVTAYSLALLLLVVALACARSWRMLLTFRDERHDGGAVPDALAHTLRHDGFPLLVGSTALAVGLAVMFLSESPALRQFGATAFFSIIANFVLILLLFLGFGRAFPRMAAQQSPEKPLALFTLSAKITALHDRYRLATLAGLLLLLIVACAGIVRIRVDLPFFPLLKPDSPVMQRLSTLNGELAGVSALHIAIDAGQADRIKEPEILRQIDGLQQFLRADERLYAAGSLVNALKIVHREMNAGRLEMYAIPGSRAAIAQYLRLLKDTGIDRDVSPDYAVAHLLVRHQLDTYQSLSDAVAGIRRYVDDHFSNDLTVSITSPELADAEAAVLLLRAHAVFPVLLLLLVFLLLVLTFLSVNVGFAALFPALLSVLCYIGITGWLRIPFNAGSALLAMLAFGLSLNHTISFLVRYRECLMLMNDQELAVSTTIYHEAEPVFITSLALAMGFGLLAFSGVPALAQAGVASILMVGIVLLAVYLLNPRILDAVRPITVWDFLQVNLSHSVIHTSPIFQDLRRSQIKRIILLGSIRQAAQDEEILCQGDEGHDMYMVLSGKLEVFLNEEGGPNTISLLEPGGIVGEMALYGEHIRSANVRALEEARLLRIDEKSLMRVKKSEPRIAAQLFFNISALLTERLRKQMGQDPAQRREVPETL